MISTLIASDCLRRRYARSLFPSVIVCVNCFLAMPGRPRAALSATRCLPGVNEDRENRLAVSRISQHIEETSPDDAPLSLRGASEGDHCCV